MLRLTDRAVQALRGAEQLAWQGGQPRVEPTHLLQAVLARPDSLACRVLAGLGVDPQAAARRLEVASVGQQGPSEEAEVGRVPFSHAAKGVLERAAEEARAFGHRYVGTEHLLLALLAADDKAGQSLRDLGADLPRARQALRALLQFGSAGAAPDGPPRPSGSPGPSGPNEAPPGPAGRRGPGDPQEGPAA